MTLGGLFETNKTEAGDVGALDFHFNRLVQTS